MYFNTRFVSYSVNIQADIIQNYCKICEKIKNILKGLWKFLDFFYFYKIFLSLYNIFYLFIIIIWAGLGLTQPYRPDLARSIGSTTTQQTWHLSIFSFFLFYIRWAKLNPAISVWLERV